MKFKILKSKWSAITSAIFILFILFVIKIFFVEKEYIIIVLPDTQYYCAYRPDIFYYQISWILKNKDKIDYIIHLGDVVQNYKHTKQWTIARNFLIRLSKQIPVMAVPGNHDCQNKSEETPDWRYFKAFISKNTSNFDFLVKGSDSLLILGIEWNPNKKLLNWADSILMEYSHLRSIVFTHEYLNIDGNRSEIGERIWEKVISKHENIILVLNGHFFGAIERIDSVNNKPIKQHLFNFQHENYGNGWLRIYKIGKKVTWETYSPYLDQSRY